MRATQLLLPLLAVSTYASPVHNILPKNFIQKAAEVDHNPDWGLDIIQYGEKYGYTVESHHVTTEDGYILTLHRIPRGRAESPSDDKKPAVLLVHGLLGSSIDWINQGPEKSIGLLLADQGYDVWLANSRGNVWSRRHTTLDPDSDPEFWAFSFDEGGNYDLPGIIDHIIGMTGQEKISFIGHSQGTSEFFAMASLKPEYNRKITVALAFAPIAYIENAEQPLIQFMSANWGTVQVLADLLGIYEVFPHSEFITDLAHSACYDGAETQEICADILFSWGGFDSPQLNRSLIEVILSNLPAGGSVHMISHYVQEHNSGYFRRYDYGPIKNLEIYRQFVPPNYRLASVTAPVALYYGQNDYLAAVEDVEKLAGQLPNVVEKKLIDYDLFSNLDFLWAEDVDKLLNIDAIKLLNKYNNL